jgi:hypothetical protein
MRWRFGSIALLVPLSCGGPVLNNAPKPDPNVVAAAAAAAATAATLADPDYAQKHAEGAQKGDPPPKQGVHVDQDVPADVLDRLDSAKRDGGVDAVPAPPPAP